MRGQPDRRSACRGRSPEVAAVCEDKSVAINIRKAQQLGLRARAPECAQEKSDDRDWAESTIEYAAIKQGWVPPENENYSPNVVELFTRDYWGCLRGSRNFWPDTRATDGRQKLSLERRRSKRFIGPEITRVNVDATSI